MKKTATTILGVIVATVIAIFAANSLIRVSDGSGASWGIVEEKVFGKNIVSFLEPPWSDNYRRWELANQTSAEIAELIQNHGQEIFTDPTLEEKRLLSTDNLKVAYLAAKEIDLEYLETSNTQLPMMYSGYFVEALSMWHEGFSSKNPQKVAEGTSSYNEFLLWMQSQDKSEFKPLR